MRYNFGIIVLGLIGDNSRKAFALKMYSEDCYVFEEYAKIQLLNELIN
jgi:hypothetical protein